MPTSLIATRTDVERESRIPFAERQLPASTYDPLCRAAERHADRIVLQFPPQGRPDETPVAFRYGDFVTEVTRTANLFHRLGLGPDDTAVLILPNAPQTHLALWGGEAACRGGAVNPLLEPGQIADILRAMDARALVTLGLAGDEPAQWEKVAQLVERTPGLHTILTVDPAAWDGATEPSRPPERLGSAPVLDFDRERAREPGDRWIGGRVIRAGDGASLFQTGGTTGAPKIAPHTHANETFMAWNIAFTLGMQPEDVVLCGLPLFHVNAALVTGLAVWQAGAQVILAGVAGYRTPGLINRFWRLVERHRVTYQQPWAMRQTRRTPAYTTAWGQLAGHEPPAYWRPSGNLVAYVGQPPRARSCHGSWAWRGQRLSQSCSRRPGSGAGAGVTDDSAGQRLWLVSASRRLHRAVMPVRRKGGSGIAPACLGAIHRCIRVFQQRVRIPAIVREERHPDAHRHRQFMAVHPQGRLERGKHLAGYRLRGGVVRDILQNNYKFIAAETSDGIGFPQAVLQPLRHGFQHGIARGMPQAVIDRLEMIDIHEQHGERALRPLGPRQGVAESILQQLPVRQLGERIIIRLMEELSGEGAGFRDIMIDGHRADEVTRAIAKRCSNFIDQIALAMTGDYGGLFLRKSRPLKTVRHGADDHPVRVFVAAAKHLGDWAPDRLGARPATEAFRHRIQVLDRGLGIGNHHALAQGGKNGLQALLFLKQALFDPLTLGDFGHQLTLIEPQG